MTGEVEVLHIHANRVHRASFGAKAAEAAAEDVYIEPLGELLDGRVGRFAGGDMDAVARADRLAEHTGGAAHCAVLLLGEAVSAAPADVDRALLFGVLVGGRDALFLFDAEHLERVPDRVAPEVGIGDPKPSDDFDPVDLLRDAGVKGNGSDFFWHLYWKCEVLSLGYTCSSSSLSISTLMEGPMYLY